MSIRVLHSDNRICFFASYEEPEAHSHFAKHIIIGKEPFTCSVDGEAIVSRAVFIKSLTPHSIKYNDNSELFVMLIDETSDISKIIDDVYLKGKSVGSLPDNVYDAVTDYLLSGDLFKLDKVLIESLFGRYKMTKSVDDRIKVVTDYIESLETIETGLFRQMADMCYLSESRFSHLFKSEMGIDFKNYALMKKFEKAYMYVAKEGASITEASIKAGFSSPSHFATVCKKHFGISLRSFINS